MSETLQENRSVSGPHGPKVHTAAKPAHPEEKGFELPNDIWFSMIGCYAVFFIGLLIALGSEGRAIFAIVISALYTVMYFSVAAMLAALSGSATTSPANQTGSLMTHTGPMSRAAVYGQVLIVPLAVALFGIAVSLIIIAVGIPA